MNQNKVLCPVKYRRTSLAQNILCHKKKKKKNEKKKIRKNSITWVRRYVHVTAEEGSSCVLGY
jgi:hypothetical protein